MDDALEGGERGSDPPLLLQKDAAFEMVGRIVRIKGDHLVGDAEGFVYEATLEVGCGKDVSGEEGAREEGKEGITLLYGFVPTSHLKADLGEGFAGFGYAGST
jgi:hypothetical protein